MKSKKIQYWLQAGLWLTLIYTSIPFVRPICEALKQRTPFNLLVNIIVIGALLAFIISLVKKIKADRLTYLLFFIAAVIYGFGMYYIKIPEERIHFVEYGVLGILIVRALRLDAKDFKSFIWAFLLTSLLGWLDEGIQYLTPGRYYSVNDVLLNLVSGVMGMYLYFIYERSRRIDKK